MLYILLAAIIGFISWSGNLYGLILAPFIALLWANSKTRLHSYLIILSYYLAASHGLIQGAGVFLAINILTSHRL